VRIGRTLVALAMLLPLSCGDGGSSSDTDGDTDTGTGSGGFAITSSAFADQGELPIDYSCDGEGVSPPLAWTGAPAGTVELALLMTTEALDGTRWNWVLCGIPANVTSLPEGGGGIGTAGLTSDGPLLQYYPPCSKGPGAKPYTFTVYALSEAPAFSVPPEQVSGPIVTDAVKGITLASAAISVSYTRVGDGGP
jgi:phosphatidylethanolamine-binding protein (PEBP) family uncharacterized protein